jgi:hypothetical protein
MLYYTGHKIAFFRSDQSHLLLARTHWLVVCLRSSGSWVRVFFSNFYYLIDCFQCAIEWSCDMDYEPKNPYSSPRSASLPSTENSTPDGPRKSDASEKWVHTETPPPVRRSTRSSSAKGTLCRETSKCPCPNKDTDTSAGDHGDHIRQQEGTELVSVRVDRSVVVGVGPWNAERSDEPDSDEPCRKSSVRWDQGLV